MNSRWSIDAEGRLFLGDVWVGIIHAEGEGES